MSVVTNITSRTPFAFAQRTIHAPIGEVWPYFGAIGAEKIYIPGVLKSSLIEGHGAGSRRQIVIKEGTVVETIVDYQPLFRVAYELEKGHPFPGEGISGVVELKTSGQNDTIVTWSTFYTFLEPAIETDLRKSSNERFREAIKNVASLVER